MRLPLLAGSSPQPDHLARHRSPSNQSFLRRCWESSISQPKASRDHACASSMSANWRRQHAVTVPAARARSLRARGSHGKRSQAGAGPADHLCSTLSCTLQHHTTAQPRLLGPHAVRTQVQVRRRAAHGELAVGAAKACDACRAPARSPLQGSQSGATRRRICLGRAADLTAGASSCLIADGRRCCEHARRQAALCFAAANKARRRGPEGCWHRKQQLSRRERADLVDVQALHSLPNTSRLCGPLLWRHSLEHSRSALFRGSCEARQTAQSDDRGPSDRRVARGTKPARSRSQAELGAADAARPSVWTAARCACVDRQAEQPATMRSTMHQAADPWRAQRGSQGRCRRMRRGAALPAACAFHAAALRIAGGEGGVQAAQEVPNAPHSRDKVRRDWSEAVSAGAGRER
jgi:hypothetical protein